METECPPPPVNDVCERAQRISEVPTTINANLTLVPPVVEDQVSNCTSLTFSNSRAGLWYEFVGDGGCYEAKTARIVSDAKVAVFEGSCDEPLCVSDSFGSSVDFRAKEGVIYKILASGDGYRGEMALELVYVSGAIACS